MFNWKKNYLIYSIFFIGCIFLFLFFLKKISNQEEKKLNQFTSKETNNEYRPKISVLKIKNKWVVDKIVIPAQLMPYSELSVFPDIQISGIVRRLFFKDGDFVKKNDVLMEIDQNFTQLETYLPFKVRAQASGFISKIIAYPGYKVNSGTLLLKIIQKNRLKLKMYFASNEIKKVKLGIKVKLLLKNTKNKNYITKINYIDPQVDVHTQQFSATALINNKDYHLVSGIRVRVEVHFSERMVFLVPLKSVKLENNIYYVYIYDEKNQYVIQKKVKIGNLYGQFIEIVDGLNTYDLVVTSGQDFIINYQKVQLYDLSNN